MTREEALACYGSDADKCCVCFEWCLPDSHFDGTYFTCDPTAPLNQPGYVEDEDGERS
jgi:hypothetical protein